MMTKNYLQKKAMKGHVVWELVLPIMIGALMYYEAYQFKDDGTGNMILIRDILIPFLFCVLIPNLTSLSSRFIL